MDFFQTQDLRYSNPLLKKLEKTFCLEFFSIKGMAQDKCGKIWESTTMQNVREASGKVWGMCEKDTATETMMEGPRKDKGSFLENPGMQGREKEALDSS